MKVYVLGRAPINGPGEIPVVIEDVTNAISRTHCKITQIDGQTFFIEDAGSKNGTEVNGNLVKHSQQISSDTQIKLSNNLTFTPQEVVNGAKLKVKQKQSNNQHQSDSSTPEKPKPKSEMAKSNKPNAQPSKPNNLLHKANRLKHYPKPNKIIPAAATSSVGVSAGAVIAAIIVAIAAIAAVYYSNISETGIGSNVFGVSKDVTFKNITFHLYGDWKTRSIGNSYTILKEFDNTNTNVSMMDISIETSKNNYPPDIRHVTSIESTLNVTRKETFTSNNIDWEVEYDEGFGYHKVYAESAPMVGFGARGNLGNGEYVIISASNIYFNVPDQGDLDEFMQILKSIKRKY